MGINATKQGFTLIEILIVITILGIQARKIPGSSREKRTAIY
jgi:prepilin-type N-terminal cleavage/methylation domain-containing protein